MSSMDLKPPPPEYYTSEWKLLSQGAEARVWITPALFHIASDDVETVKQHSICKERFPKSYRHPSLDKHITKSRLKAEAKCLARCRRNGVPCPGVLSIDLAKSCLFLEYLNGCTVREFFLLKTIDENSTGITHAEDDASKNNESPQQKRPRVSSPSNGQEMSLTILTRTDSVAMQVAYGMGILVAKMHNANVIHGDLTTSNIILQNPPLGNTSSEEWSPKLSLIDFGLAGTAGSKGVSHEEKAVDLYVLERAFVSTHPGSDDLVLEFHRAYKRECTRSDAVLQRLSAVRLRGRKRECFG